MVCKAHPIRYLKPVCALRYGCALPFHLCPIWSLRQQHGALGRTDLLAGSSSGGRGRPSEGEDVRCRGPSPLGTCEHVPLGGRILNYILFYYRCGIIPFEEAYSKEVLHLQIRLCFLWILMFSHEHLLICGFPGFLKLFLLWEYGV